MALTQAQVNDVCCLWKGELQCRYLDSQDYSGQIVYVCRKLSPYKAVIDEEVAEFKSKSKIVMPAAPLGDNCSGYITLLHKKQGYNIKGKT